MVYNNDISLIFSILFIDSEDTMNGLDTMSNDGILSSDYGLVINGHSLVWALNPSYEELFLQVATQCKYF